MRRPVIYSLYTLLKRVFHLSALTSMIMGCGPSRPLHYFQPEIDYGGRVAAVAVNPNDDDILFVASESGGLYKTSNGGLGFGYIENFPSFRITDVKYAPNNSRVVLVATSHDLNRQSKGGLWRSEDGGKSWSFSTNFKKVFEGRDYSNCQYRFTANSISFVPNTDSVYVGTSCGAAVSADLGKTWKRVEFLNDTYANVTAIQALPDGTLNAVFYARDVWHRSKKSNNGWIKQTGIHPTPYYFQSPYQLATSPLSDGWVAFTAEPNRLYVSNNGGFTWAEIQVPKAEPNRSPFVAIQPSPVGNTVDIYFGNGTLLYKGRIVNHLANGPSLTSNGWKMVKVEHYDPTTIVFGNKDHRSLLLANDGGVEVPDASGNWKQVGHGLAGYNALQINQVEGFRIKGASKTHLYFVSHDNHFWRTEDADKVGKWKEALCCEGSEMQMYRRPDKLSEVQITGRNCAPCSAFSTNYNFTTFNTYKNPPGEWNGRGPTLIGKANYVTFSHDKKGNSALYAIRQKDKDWTKSLETQYQMEGFPVLSMDNKQPVLFTLIKSGMHQFKNAGFPMPKYKLLKIEHVFSTQPVKATIVPGLEIANLDQIPYSILPIFAVNPLNSNHLFYADAKTHWVLSSRDGGKTWMPEQALTDLITDKGKFRFDDEYVGLSMISTIQFHPDDTSTIWVGTVENGIIRSNDSGKTWGKVKNSEQIPRISDFFFDFDNSVVVSSYGRGLWKIKPEQGKTKIDSPSPMPELYEQEDLSTKAVLSLEVNTPYVKAFFSRGAENTDTLHVFGLNFIPTTANGQPPILKVLDLDYQQHSWVDQETLVRDNGSFELKITLEHLPYGQYVLLVEQAALDQELTDAVTFRKQRQEDHE